MQYSSYLIHHFAWCGVLCVYNYYSAANYFWSCLQICEVKRRNLLEVLPVLRIDYSVLIDIILQDVSCEGNRACTWILIWLKVDNRRSWFLLMRFCQCSGCIFSQFYETLEYADSLGLPLHCWIKFCVLWGTKQLEQPISWWCSI